MDARCPHCGAHMFVWEKCRASQQRPVFNLCCQRGMVRLPILTAPPDPIRRLLLDSTLGGQHFQHAIRAYNNIFAFASLAVNLDETLANATGGAYTFRVNGTLSHRMGPLLQDDENQPPCFAQIYIYDSEEQLDHRQQRFRNLNRGILGEIQMMLLNRNPFAQTIQSAAERLRDAPDLDLSVRISADSDRQRRYNAPTAAEVAVVVPGSETDRDAPDTRDVVYISKHGEAFHINETHAYYDPLRFVLLLPEGELGWTPYINSFPERIDHSATTIRDEETDMLNTNNHDVPFAMNQDNDLTIDDDDGENNEENDEEQEEQDDDDEDQMLNRQKSVSCRQFYAFMLQVRDDSYLHYYGRLFHEYIVDQYMKIELGRLKFLRFNQDQLRAVVYQGAADAVTAGDTDARQLGQRIVLPSSFTGGPRYMHQQYQDAMAIVRTLGKPDLFITFTCNPNWPEVVQALSLPQQQSDRPDLVCRIFRQKLQCLMDDIKKKSIFGRVIGDVHVVEFQKRGLPHAHILVILDTRDKPHTPDDFDKIVCAEIPDPEIQPNLYDTVRHTMIHRPCGIHNRNAPCMQDGNCTKGYPKAFHETTTVNEQTGYVRYRRRDNGRIIPRAHLANFEQDNTWIIPYNPYLTMKYNAHINVEICSTAKSVKYVYKYVYKGHDRANTQLIGNGNDDVTTVDEIRQFQDSRYISACEAVWRIFGYSLHKQNPTINRLPVHLPESQWIVMQQDADIEQILDQHEGSKLTAWFQLNTNDTSARRYLYTEIPNHYSFNDSTHSWTRRRRSRSAIGRIYFVQPRDVERFSLRLLLLNVAGATSYLNLRTYPSNVIHETFHAAALARGLLQDDNEWMALLEEFVSFQTSAHQMRKLFVLILVHCEPASPHDLWDRFKDDFSADFLHLQEQQGRAHNSQEAHGNALLEIDYMLENHGISLAAIPGMPVPSQNIRNQRQTDQPMTLRDRDLAQYDTQLLQRELTDQIASLNQDQRAAYRTITTAIESADQHQFDAKLYFIDGPGGTGKTYLYNVLLNYVRSTANVAIAVATSGIAALLLRGGRTAHSTFRIPINLDHRSTCQIAVQNDQADMLRHAQLIIWDEAPLAHRHAVESVDRLLKDIMGTVDERLENVLFGGKVVVFGGDFRQCLPVINHASPAEIIAACLKRSYIWSHVQSLQLSENMRIRASRLDGNNTIADQITEFTSYLLRIGDGTEVINSEPDYIALPQNAVRITSSLATIVDETWSDLNERARNDPLSLVDAAILTPLNANVTLLNEAAIQRLDGEEHVYNALNSTVESGDNDAAFPPEYLSSIVGFGIQPNTLKMKKGMPIMLIRNLDPVNGLCNGTRLICRRFQRNLIEAQIASGDHRGTIVYIPRISLCTKETDELPFILKRHQFPVVPSFAMTINKSQGQTMSRVSLFLPYPVFTHGQLYVAFSRVNAIAGLKIFFPQPGPQDLALLPPYITRNVVYRQVL